MGMFDGLLPDYSNSFGQGGYTAGNQGGNGYGNQNGGGSLFGGGGMSSFGNNPLGTIGAMIPALQYSQNQGQYTQNQNQILQAMQNPQSQAYQNLYQQNRQAGQQALGSQIQQLTAQNQKQMAMGRVPLFDSQYGGQQLFRGITAANESNQNQANTQTQQQLGQAYNAANQLGQRQQQGGLTSAQGLSGLGGLLGTALGKSGGLLSGIFG